MLIPKFIPRRCARGYNSIDQAAGHNLHVILYNNSTGPQLLIVRDMQVNTETGAQVDTALVNGSVGGNAVNGQPIVPGEATPPGQVLTLESTTVPTPDYVIGTDTAVPSMPWVHDFPFTILQPGWSLQLSTLGTGASTMRVGFFWQWCYADEVDRLFDLDIEI